MLWIHPKDITIILILQKKAPRFIELGNVFKATELDVLKLEFTSRVFQIPVRQVPEPGRGVATDFRAIVLVCVSEASHA